MNKTRQTRVFIHFPSTGQIFDVNVNYEDTIYQFISRILQSSNINGPETFKLYSIDKKCHRFRPEESCSSLFGIRCSQLVLTRSELVNVDLFFENYHYNVIYDTSTPAMKFIDNAIHLLQSTSTKFCPPLTKTDVNTYYFALYDPVGDIVIPSKSSINTKFVVLKRFEYIAPGYVFDFSHLKEFYGKLSNCSFESSATSNFIKQVRSYHRREHLSGINFIEFTEERAQFLFESFRNKLFDKSEVTLSEQINFLFTVLSLAKQPYIPLPLRKMIVYAMSFEDDRKVFDVARAIAIYLPLSTHLVLEELFQLFGAATIDESSWNVVSLMLTELLFESKTDDTEENYNEDDEDQNRELYLYESSFEKEERESEVFTKFTRFLLLYFKQIFQLKENIGRKNSIRMIKKIQKSDSKGNIKIKKEKKAKGDKKAKKKKEIYNSEENLLSNDDIPQLELETEPKKTKKKKEAKNSDASSNISGSSSQFDIEMEQKRSKSDRKKKENKILHEIPSINNISNSDTDLEPKRSKSERKAKNNKKFEATVKSDDENLTKKDFLLKEKKLSRDESKSTDEALDEKNENTIDQTENSEKSEIDNDNYLFILYEEMKPQQMITRTIDGFIDINIDETIEFVPNDSIFDLLCSLVHDEKEDWKEQDISTELDELNDIIRILRVKFNSAGFADPSSSPNSKERKQPSLIL